MKLLLTSSGIKNATIGRALFELVGKEPHETSVVFVPTAANVEVGDKDWFIEDLVNLQKQKFALIDIADISAVDREIWLPKFEKADVLFFEGGNTFHLMRWINKSGLAELLPELLKTKVYVGVSAGSMVTGKDLQLKTAQIIYDEDMLEKENMPALNLVDFYFLPHLNSEHFSKMREENIRRATAEIKEKVYALDDESALKIVDDRVEVVSEGDWFVVNA